MPNIIVNNKVVAAEYAPRMEVTHEPGTVSMMVRGIEVMFTAVEWDSLVANVASLRALAKQKGTRK